MDDEFNDEDIFCLQQLKNITKVAIYPQEMVVLPFEGMTLEVREANFQKLFADAKVEDGDVWCGIAPLVEGEKLPTVGSIGVGVDIEDISQMPGNLQLIKVRGVVRFTIDEYLETDKPFPVVRVTFFEDDKEMRKVERQMKPELFKEFKQLMQEYNRRYGKHKYFQNPADTLEMKYYEVYTFFHWTIIFSKIHPEIRRMILEMRSTVQRAYVLNQQIKRTMKKLEDKKISYNN